MSTECALWLTALTTCRVCNEGDGNNCCHAANLCHGTQKGLTRLYHIGDGRSAAERPSPVAETEHAGIS